MQIKKDNLFPCQGIEPWSPAIRDGLQDALTGGYTDHYTNKELVETTVRNYTYLLVFAISESYTCR